MLEKLIDKIVKPFAYKYTGVVVAVRYQVPRFSLDERDEWDDKATQMDDFGRFPQIVTYRTHYGKKRTLFALTFRKKIEESRKKDVVGYQVEKDGTLTALRYKKYDVGDHFP